MVIVIDFDGTLALGDTADITKMYPNLKLITLLQEMYDDGNYIKIATARGCKSCASIQERENKYKDIIVKWLTTNNVRYHELSFIKEYGDIYIDDRAYNAQATINYKKLDSQFTDNAVRRFNDCVVKKSTTSKNEKEWYNKAIELELNVPNLLSYDTNTIATSFVDGMVCNNVELLVDVLRKFKRTKPTNKVNFNSYIDRITNHLYNNPGIHNKNKVIDCLNVINPPNTFNHGDFSTHNIIQSNDKLFLIDPIYDENVYQSYVIDAAKHLFSVLYYDLNPNFYNLCYSNYVTRLDIDPLELDILITCESIRVSNRKKQLTDVCNNLISVL